MGNLRFLFFVLREEKRVFKQTKQIKDLKELFSFEEDPELIHSVYVIHQASGICIIYRRYGTIEFNEDLLSGFLIALKSFSQEVTGGQGTIKVLDMQIYYIILVFQEGILVAAAADKLDDRILAQNAVQQVLENFLDQFKEQIAKWHGDLGEFPNFSEKIDNIMKKGTIAVVPHKIPILSLFWKDFQKLETLKQKGKKISNEDFQKYASRKLPLQVVSQGYLSEKEYEIVHNCNGYNDTEDIAKRGGISMENLKIILEKLDNLGLLKMLEVT
ncbi:MAG: hypothetical protein RBG13Loki_1659 [Promethearchaeota archaeon CR_4]|nr:MAG: hypothetical protein RBG13Loki_1659 [Candidatus Lokiarchaeota archaeon CR_4]